MTLFKKKTMSISVHCFERCNIRSLFCCEKKNKEKKTNPKKQDNIEIAVVGKQKSKQDMKIKTRNEGISILQISRNEYKNIIDLKNLDSEILIFQDFRENTEDPKDLRIISFTNPRIIHHKYDAEEIRKWNQNTGNQMQSLSKITSLHFSELLYQKLNDVLPDGLFNFYDNIFKQTMDGKCFQLVILYLSDTYLCRTFPIFDYNEKVVGGISVISNNNNNIMPHELEQYALQRKNSNGSQQSSPRSVFSPRKFVVVQDHIVGSQQPPLTPSSSNRSLDVPPPSQPPRQTFDNDYEDEPF